MGTQGGQDTVKVNLHDYQGADCTLYRVPTASLSRQSYEALQKKVIQHFLAGYGAESLMRNIKDSDIVDELAAQIQESLSFQRETQLRSEQQEFDETRSNILDSVDERIKGIDATYNRQVEETLRNGEDTASALYSAYSSYSTVAKNLQDLKKRVEAQMAQLGGPENLEKILNLNAQVVGTIPDTEVAAAKQGIEALSEELPQTLFEKYSARIVDKIKSVMRYFGA